MAGPRRKRARALHAHPTVVREHRAHYTYTCPRLYIRPARGTSRARAASEHTHCTRTQQWYVNIAHTTHIPAHVCTLDLRAVHRGPAPQASTRTARAPNGGT
ncbi:unnamed protein product [Parnassius apollo]|uniref:(apollo) hypothetical protein n=1 Tax=Parnassius apollo TaxID=110799 RepID=A0A8S3W625_PARAO|nr:unnamed protein product [Parnassius apollo]